MHDAETKAIKKFAHKLVHGKTAKISNISSHSNDNSIIIFILSSKGSGLGLQNFEFFVPV
jgi:hypothetical protein